MPPVSPRAGLGGCPRVNRTQAHSHMLDDVPQPRLPAGTPLLTHSTTPMAAGRLQESPGRAGGGYTSPLRGSQQSIGAFKAAGASAARPVARGACALRRVCWPCPARAQRSATAGRRLAGPTAKLEHVAERFSAFYNDLEQDRQQRKVQESARYQTMVESIGKLEKSIEVRACGGAVAALRAGTSFGCCGMRRQSRRPERQPPRCRCPAALQAEVKRRTEADRQIEAEIKSMQVQGLLLPMARQRHVPHAPDRG